MSLIGLDLNATRIRAVQGPMGAQPMGLRLEEPSRELPLALNLAERKLQVGQIGLAFCRQHPQHAVIDFLPSLGTTRRWKSGRHNIDATMALTACFERILPQMSRSEGVSIAIPASLHDRAFVQIEAVVRKTRIPLLGSIPSPLAAVRHAFQRHPWSGVALVGDVDGGGFTWSAVTTDGNQARIIEKQVYPRLGRNTWLMRLLDGVASRCIRLSRRDPRQIPQTEQALFDQLVYALDQPPGERLVEFNLRSGQWAQHLLFQPSELQVLCAPLVQEIVLRMKQCLALLPPQFPGQVIILTGSACQMPGLSAGIENALRRESLLGKPNDVGDFGEGLLQAGDLMTLDPDAIAIGAHDISCAIVRKELSPGHQETVRLVRPQQPIPQPSPDKQLLDDGPARLQFAGRDYQLPSNRFTLGRDPGCNLVFEADLFPMVGACHCDIVPDKRHFWIRDHSRQGTLINERLVQQKAQLHPGDWIRLGAGGPVLRFVGTTVPLRPYRES